MTKKMLVPFSMEKASPIGKSFVVPICDDGKLIFVSLSTRKPIEFGAVVYVGRDVSAEDVFTKIVETGTRILPSVDEQLSVIRNYLDCLANLKIGDVVKLGFASNGSVLLERQPRPKPNKRSGHLP